METALCTLYGKCLKEGDQMPGEHITEESGLVSGMGVQEVILELKSEGVGIKLCEMGSEAFQAEEAACAKALWWKELWHI